MNIIKAIYLNIRCHYSIKYGGCPYPYYGVRPHTHHTNLQCKAFCPDDQLPDNFEVDVEDTQCGIYFCPFKRKYCKGKL